VRRIRIGAGAGYSGDRIEPAVELAEKGDLDYLVFECLAERTIALAQLEKARDPSRGYDPLLSARMRAVLGPCRTNHVRIVTNAGAANPLAGAEAVRGVARELGQRGLRIAAITGDDVLEVARAENLRLEDTGGTVADLGDRVVSANAYIGAPPLAQALAADADVVVAGRASDTALFTAPLVHAFGWSMEDWTRLGRGALVGHLLECAGQVTGGYFADPGLKDVPGLARLGFPIGEVDEGGSLVVTKVPGSGGRVTEATCKEQLLYEIDDPARYLTPETLKVCVGYRDGFVGEGQISYAGPGAVARGRLALEIVAERLKLTGVRCREIRFDLIGVDALHGQALSASEPPPHEVRVRVAGSTDTHDEAVRIANEVESLYTNGPAGGGGATRHVREVIAVATAFLPRSKVLTQIQYLEV
jgi:hypothetical protein